MKTALTLSAILMASSVMASPRVDCTSKNPYARVMSQCARKPGRRKLKCSSAVYQKRDPATEIGTVSGWECAGD